MSEDQPDVYRAHLLHHSGNKILVHEVIITPHEPGRVYHHIAEKTDDGRYVVWQSTSDIRDVTNSVAYTRVETVAEIADHVHLFARD